MNAETALLTTSRFRDTRAVRPRLVTQTWPELATELSTYRVAAHKGGELWSPARYDPSNGARRATEHVLDVQALAYDVDDGTPAAEIQKHLPRELTYTITSTFSHTPAHHKLRVVINLTRPIPTAEFADIWQRGQAYFMLGHADESAKDAARMFYLAHHPPGVEPIVVVNDGFPLDWRRLPVVPEPARRERVEVDPTSVDDELERRRALGYLRSWQNEVGSAESGDRHRVLLNKAVAAGGLVGSGLLGESEVEDALYVASEANGEVAQYGQADVLRAINWGLGQGAERPWTPSEMGDSETWQSRPSDAHLSGAGRQNGENGDENSEGPSDSVDSVDESPRDSKNGEWGHPTPLEAEYAGPFPLAALPKWVGDWGRGVVDWLQVPPGLPGLLALATLATAAGGRAVVRGPNGNLEPLNDYCLSVLPPGARKSPAFKAATDPILDYQDAQNLQTRDERAKQASVLRQKQGRLKHLERQAGELVDPIKRQTAATEAATLAVELAGLGETHEVLLVLNDVTPEKVADTLAQQGGRLSVLSAEGDPLDIIGGRYSDGVSRLGVFLASHSGDYIAPGRISRHSPAVRNPALTIGLTIQPQVLAGLATKPEFRGRGLLARFWYSCEPSTVGYRNVAKRTPLDPSVTAVYAGNLKRLLLLLDGFDSKDPAVLKLSQPARDLLLEHEARLEPDLRPFGRLGGIVDWGSKWIGLVLRNAGRLHLAEHVAYVGGKPLDLEISKQTLRRALSIGRYQIQHALVAFGQMGADTRIEGARWILGWLVDTGLAEFSRRDAHTALRGRTAFKRAEALDPPLALLADHDYVRLLLPEPRPKTASNPLGAGRSPSPRYQVNPLWGREAPFLDPLGKTSTESTNSEGDEEFSSDEGAS